MTNFTYHYCFKLSSYFLHDSGFLNYSGGLGLAMIGAAYWYYPECKRRWKSRPR